MMRKLFVAMVASLVAVLITVWLKPDTTYVATTYVASGFSRTLSYVVSGFSRTVYAQAAEPQAIVNQYCVTCHNGKLKTAGLMLDAVDASNVGHDAEIWEKVWYGRSKPG